MNTMKGNGNYEKNIFNNAVSSDTGSICNFNCLC
jgi:hypothetical protein